MKAFWDVEFVRPTLSREVIAPPPMKDGDESQEAEQEAEELSAEEQEELWEKWYWRAVKQLPEERDKLERAMTSDLLSLGLVQPRISRDKPGVRLIYTFSRFHPTAIRLSIPGFFVGLLTPVPGGALVGAIRRSTGYYRIEARLEDCRSRVLAQLTVEVAGKKDPMRELSRKLRRAIRPHVQQIDSACVPKGLYFAGSYVP